MINIISKKQEIDMGLKKKIKLVCDFYNNTPKFINRNIRNIERSNLSYI